MSCFLGIDPGVAGGLALIAQNGRPLTALKMPATERELCDVMCQLAACDELRGMIEKLDADGNWRLSYRQIASRLQLSERTVRRWIREAAVKYGRLTAWRG